MLYPAKTLSFVMLILFCGLIYYRIYTTRKSNVLPQMRPIPALEAIDEAIGRATELGAPVHFSPGLGDIIEEEAGQMLASLQFLQHIAERCARYKTALIATIPKPNVFPLAQEVVRQGFLAAGAPEAYTPDTVRFLSSEQMAYTAAVLGIFKRERPGANFLIGAFFAETMLIAEGAAQIGAIQVGGTARLFQLPFLIVSCDYTLIGEEVFAGGAYLGKNPIQMGSLAGQDICKIICLVVTALGIITRTVGINFIYDLIGKFGK